jgi:arylsulfatase
MAVYAAMITLMDEGIGRIIATLEQQGALDNTLIFFLADNGGCAEVPHVYKERLKTMTEEQLSGRVGNETSYVGYEDRWANASNTPFRLYKHWVHEGGIATPFVAHWPAVIPPGGLAHAPCHLVDITATCLDAAGAPYPDAVDGRPITPPEGESLLSLLRGEPWGRRNAICWEHEGNRAVRQGNWKLVSQHPGAWELYDMDADRTELNDLGDRNPDKVKELAAVYEAWAARCGVVPWAELPSPPRGGVRQKRGN